MQTTFKIFFLCLFCLSLTLLSGCGNRDLLSENAIVLTPADQAKIDKFIAQTNTPPELTPIEQREADQYIERYKQAVIPYYLRDHLITDHYFYGYFETEEMRRNADAKRERVVEYLKYFVSQGASVNVQDSSEEGLTALQWLLDWMERVVTMSRGNADILNEINVVKFLVSQGADANTKTAYGVTPLYVATIGGSIELVKFLISKGADVNAKNDFGNTPLRGAIRFAIRSGDAEIVKLLDPRVATDVVDRIPCSNRLRLLAAALHNYHDSHDAFLLPLYTVDENGKPLHSWRVLLLPYIEQHALYNQIRLDEPWDSPHNSQFHQVLISTYVCPDNPNVAGRLNCTYSAISGDVAGRNAVAFIPATEPGRLVGNSFAAIRDGLSNTVDIVEVRQPFNWMDPTADMDLETFAKGINKPDGRAGSFHERGINIGLFDGSVQFIMETIDSSILRALGTCSDGEPRILL